MTEGTSHKLLVSGLRRVLTDRYPGSWHVFTDGGAPSAFGVGRPPTLESVRPDLFARNPVTTGVIIGEAKSSRDIENPHTENQLREYFQFLEGQTAGTLLLSVPYFDAGTAFRLCRSMRTVEKCKSAKFEVIGWMFGAEPRYGVWSG
jgi:hypothetical protein